MAIDSVSSAVSPTVQQPPQNRETQRSETQRAERPQPQRPPEPSRQTQQAQFEPQQPKAVVNTEGQVTGTRVNTTA